MDDIYELSNDITRISKCDSIKREINKIINSAADDSISLVPLSIKAERDLRKNMMFLDLGFRLYALV